MKNITETAFYTGSTCVLLRADEALEQHADAEAHVLQAA